MENKYEYRNPYAQWDAEKIASKLCDTPKQTANDWRVPCPCHNGEDYNMAIRNTVNGPFVTCFSAGCDPCNIWESIHGIIGAPMKGKKHDVKDETPKVQPNNLPQKGDINTNGYELKRAYIYRDKQGNTYAATLRWEKGSDKTFQQWSCNGDGEWVARYTRRKRYPYRLQDVEAHSHTGQPLLIVEGEKCVDSVMKQWPDLVAVTWMGGAKAVTKTEWNVLANWRGPIHLWPDNDVPGHKAMATLGAILAQLGLDLHMHKAYGEDKCDVSDYLADGHTEYPTPEPYTADMAASFDMGDIRVWPRMPELKLALHTIGEQARYDNRAQKFQWLKDGEWIPTSDNLEANIRNRIEQTQQFMGHRDTTNPLHYSVDRWRMGLGSIGYDNNADAFLEYVEGCIDEPEPSISIDNLLQDIMLVREGYEELAQWVSRFWFLGSIHRAYNPGAKLDETPVLISPNQGQGKSTLLRYLFPENKQGEWFTDNLDLDARRKEFTEAMQGRVLVEFSEMVWDSKASVEKLKSVLSSADDGGTRLSYRHNPEPMPRRSIFTGTSNNEGCLPLDESGNRRWVVIATDGMSVEWNVGELMEYMNLHRNKLWGQALRLYKDGAVARLPDNMATMQARLNDKHVHVNDYWDARVKLALRKEPALSDPFTMDKLCKELLIKDPSIQLQTQLGAIMRSEGYTKRRRRLDGIKAFYWSK